MSDFSQLNIFTLNNNVNQYITKATPSNKAIEVAVTIAVKQLNYNCFTTISPPLWLYKLLQFLDMLGIQEYKILLLRFCSA